MRRSYPWILLAAAAWSIWVWAVFIYNQVRTPDPHETVMFKIVHFSLAGISILFALAVGTIAIKLLRFRRGDDVPASPESDLTAARS